MLGPTLVEVTDHDSELAREEIFGPVLALVGVPDLDAAIEFANGSRYGNAGSIFTTSGATARAYRWGIEAGMLGVNIGVPAPVAWFPFSGWKDSIDGDLHANGSDAVDFYTRKKVVTTAGSGRSWPRLYGEAVAVLYQESTVRPLGAGVPAAARVRAIVARVSAGSITSSISKIWAAFSALACSYICAVRSRTRCSRSSSSSIASRSRRMARRTAPSRPMGPSVASGHAAVSSGSCRLPNAIA